MKPTKFTIFRTINLDEKNEDVRYSLHRLSADMHTWVPSDIAVTVQEYETVDIVEFNGWNLPENKKLRQEYAKYRKRKRSKK